MKRGWCLVLLVLVFLATGICAARVPDLLGNWTGSANGYAENGSSTQLLENFSIGLEITEQKDRLFAGNLSYTANGTKIVEGLAGAIGLDNKSLYIAEFDKGYDLGTIVSDDEIELIYLQDGSGGEAFVDDFHRVKP
jgi:hypothetical protein